jgi:lipopolysaccharide export system protein LptA
LQNRQAARYARWAAFAAAVVAFAVVAMYGERMIREARVRRREPSSVPSSVQQQSAQFSFSKVEQDRTIFTIRASHATQYKDQNRALLEDVWITLYGRDGKRNDNIHTRECSYEPDTGAVRCEGDVQIDIGNAAPDPGKPAKPDSSLEIRTSNLSFNRDTGEASTPAPVEFRFAGGTGRGVGISYSTSDSIVRVEHTVEFDLAPSAETDGLPVTATGSSLAIHRNERTVALSGPALVRQGARELSAGTILVELNAEYQAQRAIAEGSPEIHAVEQGANELVSANHFEVLIDAARVDKVIADGKVTASRQNRVRSDRFSAAHVEFDMLPDGNLIREMMATGAVDAESRQGSDTHRLQTDALRVRFAAPHGHPTGKGTSANQQIENVETLAPAIIESKNSDDVTTLRAKQFVANTSADGRLNKLFGHSGVEIRRQAGHADAQIISAAELAATFGAHGDWETLDETGNVRFRQASREATAARASIVRATDAITLEGSPVISDSMSRSTASKIVFNQKSGELLATGAVVSTYIPNAEGDAVSLGSGAAHISADALSGSASSGHVVYTGHARLWQGDAVLDCDQIELWRDTRKMRATGDVVAVFPQADGPFAALPGKTPPSAATSSAKVTLWKIRAPMLTYSADEGKAHLESGVLASSSQGSLQSRILDVFLGPATTTPAASAAPATSAVPSTVPMSAGGRQLSRVLAQGNVVVRQGDRRGMAEQAEYTAADGKFVLSGGQPTLADASSDTTTGHSLTFFVASDTILIDSQQGSRTLTRHRIEK